MSKYFAKYLPVEGKGDIGCRWQWFNNVQNTGWEDVSQGNMDAIIAHGLDPQPKFRKLKLFLCSRDIQVGDKECIISNPDGSFTDHMECEVIRKDNYAGFIRPSWGQVNSFLKDCFKVIGEISSEATWVKEGDEFDEEEIKRTYSERYYDFEAEEAEWDTHQLKGTDPDPKPKDSWHFNPIKIRCSNCKSFH